MTLIPLLALLAARQTARSSKVVEDFASGFGKWTASGNCWRGSAPFDVAAYNARRSVEPMTGLSGRFAALSIDRSNAETGRLVSRPFTVEWPEIAFDIAGGDYAGKTCLNLVVDRRVVRTATGNGSLVFARKSFDLREFKGKTATLEIVDDSKEARFGFIGVGDIRGEEQPTDLRGAEMLEVGGLERYDYINGIVSKYLSRPLSQNNYQILSYFAKRLSDDVSLKSCFERFGVSSEGLRKLRIDAVRTVLNPSYDYVPDLGIDGWKTKFLKGLEALESEYPSLASNRTLRDYSLGCLICGWVRTHMTTDDAVGDYPAPERIRRYESNYLLSLPNLTGVCADYASLTRNLARACGLTAYYNSGYPRPISGVWPSGFTHSWAIIKLSDGTLVPCENTHTRVSLQVARKLNGNVVDPRSMPVDRWEYALFTSLYYGKCEAEERIGDQQNMRTMTSVIFDSWKSLPVFPDMKEICRGFDAKWKQG